MSGTSCTGFHVDGSGRFIKHLNHRRISSAVRRCERPTVIDFIYLTGVTAAFKEFRGREMELCVLRAAFGRLTRCERRCSCDGKRDRGETLSLSTWQECVNRGFNRHNCDLRNISFNIYYFIEHCVNKLCLESHRYLVTLYPDILNLLSGLDGIFQQTHHMMRIVPCSVEERNRDLPGLRNSAELIQIECL